MSGLINEPGGDPSISTISLEDKRVVVSKYFLKHGKEELSAKLLTEDVSAAEINKLYQTYLEGDRDLQKALEINKKETSKVRQKMREAGSTDEEINKSLRPLSNEEIQDAVAELNRLKAEQYPWVWLYHRAQSLFKRK
ncbi:MAG TPA: hypothetical protein VLH19_02320 [Patescibacteria group bacterium]|nr:hypothetical protein [Patescibacteria group bacterium]